MDHLITVRRPDLLIINKKKKKKKKEKKKKKRNCRIVDFDVPTDHRVKLKENEKKDTLLGNWKSMEHESNQLWLVLLVPIVICAIGTVTKGLIQGLGNKRTSWDHPNYCIIEDTEKSPGDLRTLKLQWKTISVSWCENFQGVIIICMCVRVYLFVCLYWKGSLRVTLHFGRQLYLYKYARENVCVWVELLSQGQNN